MNKFRYLQSYELLTVVLKIYRNNDTHSEKILSNIGTILDNSFTCDDFKAVLQADNSLNISKSGIDENLFIDFSHIQLQYSNLQILSFKEKISIYACALSWFEQFGLPDLIFDILERILSLENDLTRVFKNFFSESETQKTYGLNDIFILKNENSSMDRLEGDWIELNKPEEIENGDHYLLNDLSSPVKVLYIHAAKIFFVSCQDSSLLFSKNLRKSIFGWEFLGPGDFVQVDSGKPIDYYDIKSRYIRQNCLQKLVMQITNLAYSYSNGKGIRSFNLNADPGTLTGVLGVEGSGKSTFLQLLAGEIVGKSGEILINGYSLKKELYLLKGMIGYVPDNDLLFNELTVFENLHLTARLYLGKTSSYAIEKKVNTLLGELGLAQVKNTVVGSLKDKNLLPGQRRLLNIALELLRDPPILIVDNSLTPLSQSDSSRIIEILSNYSYKGKIVFTSITQADRNTFACFDKLFVLDEGGFPVYYGKSYEAWKYFRALLKLPVSQHERIGPESIIQLINTKSDVTYTDNLHRYFSPLDLYNKYTEFSETQKKHKISWKLLPDNLLHPPTLDRQYIIFSFRNFKTKIARSRELIYTTLIAPILAILISIALHDSAGITYNFATNKNIPAFFFISILFAILFGLIQSVNEIFKERNIIRKQEYLNLSRFSYINSKITYLFFIGLLQSFFYLVISNLILEIRDMFLVNLLILFSSFSFGILLGLLFSNTQRSIENIYARSIPIVIILQLLFGGGFIDLDPKREDSENYTMLFSDLMVARWGYEAAMVYQFKNNSYQKNFYNIEREYAQSEVNSIHLLPVLKSQLEYCANHYRERSDTIKELLLSVNYNLNFLATNNDIFPYENVQRLTLDEFDEELADDALEYLEYLEFYFSAMMGQTKDYINQLKQHFADSLGTDYINKLMKAYYNYAVADEVKKMDISEPIRFYNGIPLQTKYPIYQYPRSTLGRAQMYLPEKQFSGDRVDTIEFNISIIWMINLLLYILLITNISNKNRPVRET